MRRSVMIAAIVVAAMSVAPTAAFADVGPAARVDDQPVDCRPAPSGAGGGSGTGDAATGGDRTGSDPAGAEPAAGSEASGDEDPPGEPGDGGSGGQVDPDEAGSGAGPAECPQPGAAPGAAAGAETSAATMHDWGTPNRVDEFDGDLSNWSIYDGEGHAGNGRRSPDAASVKDGILTIDGDSEGKTAGMAWNPGQKYGRWEGRVRAPASDESYNALLLLWPDAENFPVGGEVDFMEMTDHLRQETELFLHYGEDNSQVQGKVQIDATQWHNWAVEWTPDRVTAYVDGREWWSTKDTSILPPGPMHLCIQLDWFPDSGSGDVTPSKMEVDWVRQYPLPDGGQGGETKDDKPGGDKPGGDKSGGDTSGGDAAGGDKPGGGEPDGDSAGGDTAGGDTAAGDKSDGDPGGGDTSGGAATGGDAGGGDTTGGDTGGGVAAGGDTGAGSEGLLDRAGQALDRFVRRTEGAPDPVQPASVRGTPSVTDTP